MRKYSRRSSPVGWSGVEGLSGPEGWSGPKALSGPEAWVPKDLSGPGGLSGPGELPGGCGIGTPHGTYHDSIFRRLLSMPIFPRLNNQKNMLSKVLVEISPLE
jgi:hypothetical protein